MNDTYYYYRNKYSYTNSVGGATNTGKTKLPLPASTPVKTNSSESVEENSSSSAGRARLMKKRRNNNIFLVNGSGENNSVQATTTTAKMSASSEIKTSNNSSNATAKSVQSAKAVNKNPSNGNNNNTKCYQLIWPDSQQAYQYLTGTNRILNWNIDSLFFIKFVLSKNVLQNYSHGSFNMLSFICYIDLDLVGYLRYICQNRHKYSLK